MLLELDHFFFEPFAFLNFDEQWSNGFHVRFQALDLVFHRQVIVLVLLRLRDEPLIGRNIELIPQSDEFLLRLGAQRCGQSLVRLSNLVETRSRGELMWKVREQREVTFAKTKIGQFLLQIGRRWRFDLFEFGSKRNDFSEKDRIQLLMFRRQCGV